MSIPSIREPLDFKATLLLDKCAAYGCKEKPTKKCAACRYVHYCSSACQKKDWKLQHKQACKALSTIHLLLPPSPPSTDGSPSFQLLQVLPISSPIHVVHTGTTDSLHLRGINGSDRHPFPGTLPNLAILLPKLSPPIQDGSLHHVTFEDIVNRDNFFLNMNAMDAVFKSLREQEDLRTVTFLFTRPAAQYEFSLADMDPGERGLILAAGGQTEGPVAASTFLTFVGVGLITRIDCSLSQTDPVAFPLLEKILFKVKDEHLLEVLSSGVSLYKGGRSGRIVQTEAL